MSRAEVDDDGPSLWVIVAFFAAVIVSFPFLFVLFMKWTYLICGWLA